MSGKVYQTPAAPLLARAALNHDRRFGLHNYRARSYHGRSGALRHDLSPIDEFENPVCHIVEEPGGIRHLTECEVPTEVYNEARFADLCARHPKMNPAVAEHLQSLEPFLDVSILAGFSFGTAKQ